MGAHVNNVPIKRLCSFYTIMFTRRVNIAAVIAVTCTVAIAAYVYVNKSLPVEDKNDELQEEIKESD
jgi:hypothetical protein